MLKKLTLATVMALGALALLASAASANKSLEPLTEGKKFSGEAEVTLEGNAKFTMALGGIESTLHMTLVLEGENSTGEVTAYEITNPTPFGLIGHCQITKAEAIGLPWTVHAEETTGENPVKTFSITEPEFRRELSGFLCPTELNTTGGTVYATPDSAEEISEVTLSGTVTTTSGNAEASGTLNVTPKEHFGIG